MRALHRLALSTMLLALACATAEDDASSDDDTEVDTDTLEETNDPGPPPTFTEVQAILSASCATGGCHDGTVIPSMVDPAWANLVDVPSIQSRTLSYIEPGDARASYLVAKIEGTQRAVGGAGGRMPSEAVSLDQADIDTIRAWVDAGAADDADD